MLRTACLGALRGLRLDVPVSRALIMSLPLASAGQPENNGNKKRPYHDSKSRSKRMNKKQKLQNEPRKDGSNEDVLLADVLSMLKLQGATSPPSNSQSNEKGEPFSPISDEFPKELDVSITELSSTGDGLALPSGSNQVLVVPYAIPGDVAKVKLFQQNRNRPFLLTDLVEITKPSTKRNDDLIKCPYFAKCSGCQLQMLSYPDQLAHKKRIIEKAYQKFSGLDPKSIPEIGETISSPLQYGYRTKLTPHFDGPQGGRRHRRNGETPKWSEVPPIGFMKKGTRITLDIEDCPLGTEAVRKGMRSERKRVADQIDTYKRGATLLLRETTERVPKAQGLDSEQALATYIPLQPNGTDAVLEHRNSSIDKKTCITDQNAISKEYVDDLVFTNPAGAFFQNNNSILPTFISYIRSHILLREPECSSPSKVTNLVDAYSGSGLFTISLSSIFKRSLGVDISSTSIASANENAKLNNLDPSCATFRAADAYDLFADISFPADETVVIIDPPRKGCDEKFIHQLLRYGPARIVYVSCNVHTQARDVGMLVEGMESADDEKRAGKSTYEIESLQGFDFFPQTSHVEGVAVLKRKIAVEKDDNLQ